MIYPCNDPDLTQSTEYGISPVSISRSPGRNDSGITGIYYG